MGTHGYFNIRGYRIVGTLEGTRQTRVSYLSKGDEDRYHAIRTHEYPLTSLDVGLQGKTSWINIQDQ